MAASIDEPMEGSGSSGEDIIGPSDDDDVEEVTLTPREVLDRIEAAWVNEKISPELLIPVEQEKDAMLEQLKLMERNLTRLDKKDMRTEIHKLEVERIKYVVVSYMRIRLFKIQKMAWYLYDAEMKRSRSTPSILMPEEFQFVKSYVKRTEEYMKATVISKCPQTLQTLEGKKFKKYPHMDAFVFFKVLQDATVEVTDSHDQVDRVRLVSGEQHVMRYEAISPLVMNGNISLL